MEESLVDLVSMSFFEPSEMLAKKFETFVPIIAAHKATGLMRERARAKKSGKATEEEKLLSVSNCRNFFSVFPSTYVSKFRFENVAR